ncbi:SET domain-containing protein, partial [Cephalotus follicularis]
QRRLRDVSVPTIHNLDIPDDQRSENLPEFCIDAGSAGNIARFINHSCEPNLFVQCVLSSHNDIKLATVVLFAADNIPPLQELTYDYGYALDSVYGPDGRILQMPCYCGAAYCRKRLF